MNPHTARTLARALALAACALPLHAAATEADEPRLPTVPVIGPRIGVQPIRPHSFGRIFHARDGGSRMVRAPIALNEEDRPHDDCQDVVPGTGGAVGNPIVVQSGNKIQDDTDFTGAGEMPLSLQRSYSAKSDSRRGLFGLGWTSNLEHTLSFYRASASGALELACEARLARSDCNEANPAALVVRTEFGREYRYDRVATTNVFRNPGDPDRSITFAAGVYTLAHPDSSSITFGADGRVVAIRNDVGLRWTYAYAADRIVITRSGGRTLTIDLDTANDVARSVIDPANQVYRYDYERSADGTRVERLAGVDYPGTLDDSRRYRYEDPYGPNRLTGISLGGIDYATFEYHANGRGKRTRHADDVGDVRLDYVVDPVSPRTDVTNALGLKNRYHYARHPVTGVQQLVRVERDPFNGCPFAAAAYTYDDRGRVDVTTDWEGIRTDVDYNAAGELTGRREGISAAHPRGLRHTAYQWTQGRLTDVIEYDVDAAGTDRMIATTTYVYADRTTATASVAGDVARQLKTISRTSHIGRRVTEDTTYRYTVHAETPDDVRLKTIVADGPLAGAGDAITTTLSIHGDVESVANALRHATRYEYDARGLPTASIDPNGDRIATTFDARGRIATTTRWYGGVARTTTYAYDRFGHVTAIVEPGRPERRFHYDDAGRLVQSIERRHAADLQSYTDAITEIRYDALSQPLQLLQYGATTQPSRCEPNGLCTPSITTRTTTQRNVFRSYDQAGRLASVSESTFGPWPTGSFVERPLEPVRTTTFRYDSNGRLIALTAPLARTTRFEYDALGRRAATVDADGGRTTMTYGFIDAKDGPARMLGVTPPGGDPTTHGYDGFGNTLFVDSPDSGFTEYTYANDGTLSTIAQADGSIRTHTYDSLGRVTQIRANRPAATELAYRLAQLIRKPPYAITPVGAPSPLDLSLQRFVYDCAEGKGIGRLCEATHGPTHWKTTYRYGDYGRLKSREERSVAGGYALQVGYRYDTFGRPEGIDYPNGDALRYGYAGGMLERIDAQFGGHRTTVADGIVHAADGRVTGYTAGNGLQWIAQFDLNGRPERIATPSVQELSYDYDPAGRIAGIVNARDAAASQTYGYDALGRVDASTRSGVAESWTYDAIGNRASHVRATRSNTLDYRGNLLTGIDGAIERHYTYNALGGREQQLDNGESTVFAYDPWGYQGFLMRMYDVGTVCEPTAGANEGCAQRNAVIYDYAVNWRGQRTHKAPQQILGIDPRCRRGGYVPGCGPTDRRRIALTQYMFEDDGSLLTEHMTEGGRTTSNYVWLAGKPIAVLRDGALYQIASDHLGRPEAVTDASRNIVWRAKNLAFHREVTQQNASFGELNLGFPGQYYDAESNLYYNWHRYYDPSTGRYTQSDPIGLEGGINTYAYAGGNPLLYVDPEGLEWQISINITGSVMPGIPGLGFLGAGMSGGSGGGLSIPDDPTNWKCYQVFGLGQVNGMAVAGAFVGIGFSGGISRSDGPMRAGWTSTSGIHGEGNAGFKVAGGIAVDGLDGTSVFRGSDYFTPTGTISGTVLPKLGWGVGIAAGLGQYQAATWASPTIGDCACK